MRAEWLARAAILLLVAGPTAALLARGTSGGETVVVRGLMAEAGGWQPGVLTTGVGERLDLELTSDDVVHGFAVARHGGESVDVMPGEVTRLTLRFDHAGTYTFYCTRWCGPNHWRMRGTIEVGEGGAITDTTPPAPYLALGLDLDAPHPAGVRPARRPSAAGGQALVAGRRLAAADVPAGRSPVAAWRLLRGRADLRRLTDQQLWDAVAFVWRRETSAEALGEGRQLYAANCAACHGESGRGDGVMAAALRASLHDTSTDSGAARHAARTPADFTASELLGASRALLHGKIVRGGMGTGMPSWGTILTDREVWALVDFLFGFQFTYHEEDGHEPDFE